VAQPLLVAAGLLSALEIFPHPADAFHVVGAAAGHSVGEITAAAGTGVITAESAMVLVRERGRAMADASALKPTGMTAVLGGDPEEVLASIAAHGLTAANNNGSGQVVAAGTVEQLAAFKEDPPAKARLIPLSVAGAFHTEHMAPAEVTLERYARAVSVHDPRTRLISNRDGEVVATGREVLGRIVTQVGNPVRWDLCMNAMAELGVTGVIEVPPAGTLTNLIKRAIPGVETVALKTPADLDAARDLVARHGSASPMDGSPTWRLVVAKAKGIIRISEDGVGTTLAPGATVATLVTSRDEHPVFAPHGGTIVEWLVEDGDPVAPGQPIIRLHPEAV
jgi:[acyl-carrier-protein] S-malonyltransferase